MDFNGIYCPVCHEAFTAESDVVVCPECGTPMHRECYNRLGHCVKEDKHAEGYVWKRPYDPQAEAARQAEEERIRQRRQQYADADKEQQDRGGLFGIGYDNVEKGTESQFFPNMRVLGPDEKIGNYTAKEYSAVVQRNANRYIPKFFIMEKSKRKVSLNLAGFFFPILWLAYRKMYKWAALAAVITLIIPLIFANKVYRYYADYTEAVQEYLMEDMETEADEDTPPPAMPVPGERPMALVINAYVELLVQVAVGLFGNFLYRKRCDELLNEAASRDGPEREAFLRKHGGVSAMNCVSFAVILYLVVMALLLLTAKTGTDLATIIWRLFQQ
ncbi:MAG: DUF2628 domain-containing protein [Clostridia bacterium]|nr:DUF2628 domain-containing protein [Clostridia bacterium]